MAAHALILQTDYNNVQLGLFNGPHLVHHAIIDKIHASRFLMDRILKLLREYEVTWSDICYIGVNQGPGPFTTLRAIIATVNGISFAKRIPLIGVDGLTAFLNEQNSKKTTIALLNAFNKDLYFGIKDKNGNMRTGWRDGNSLIEDLAEMYPDEQLLFVGNGVVYFKEAIVKAFDSNAVMPDPFVLTPTLKAIALAAAQLWEKTHEGAYKIVPLYLKSHSYQPSSPSV